MQQPQPSNPPNPLPNLSALTLLQPELQAAIDLYVRLTGPEVHGQPLPAESPMAIAQKVCKMAGFLSRVSKSAIPPDFYKVYALGIGIPGAAQWEDQTDANRAVLLNRLMTWCRKVRSRSAATDSACRAIGDSPEAMAEALWCAERGAHPLRTLHYVVSYIRTPLSVRYWWPMVNALGGRAYLQRNVLVPSMLGLDDYEYKDWSREILLFAMSLREFDTENDPIVLANLVLATFDVPYLWSANSFAHAACNLYGGGLPQARYLMDRAVDHAQSLGRQDTEEGQRVAFCAAEALAKNRQRHWYPWNTPGPTIRESIDELIEHYPLYLSSLLFGALVECPREHIAYFVQRHFYHAGNTRCNLSDGQLTTLLLHLFSGGRTGSEADDEVGDPTVEWVEDENDPGNSPRFPGNHRRFTELVEAIERVPQRGNEHWIRQRVAASVLHNALLYPIDVRGMELLFGLLARSSPTTRFSDQTIRRSLRTLFEFGVQYPMRQTLARVVSLLRMFLRFCRPALMAQLSFVDVVDRNLADEYTAARQEGVVAEYTAAIAAFMDAGVVFTPQAAPRLAAYVRNASLQLASPSDVSEREIAFYTAVCAQLPRSMSEPLPRAQEA